MAAAALEAVSSDRKEERIGYRPPFSLSLGPELPEPPPSSSKAEGSKEGGSPPPTREVASRPAMAYIAQWGKVWHADTDCKHLYYKGERRSHIREVALAEVRRLIGFPPCKDCSAAWAGALPSPRVLKIRGAQQ